MANINGSNKNDFIVGTALADTINGQRGGDFIDGGAGDDVLTGDAGDHDHASDTFVLREGGGHDVVTDFEVGSDNVLLDFNSYSDVLGFGIFEDGQEFDDFTGQTHVLVSIADFNGDGLLDTRFTVNGDDSITLLGVTGLPSGDLMGG